jgi:murein DD-endopeptidase MepM/ murein hydrolase activator NlpD
MQDLDLSGIDFTPLDETPASPKGRGGSWLHFVRTGFTLVAVIAIGAFVYTQFIPRSALDRALKDAPVRLSEDWQKARPVFEQLLGHITKSVTRPAKDVQLESNTYVVQPGDSLSKIASRYGIPYQALIAANRDAYPSLATNPGLIQVGWKLVIPPKDKAVALAQSVVLPTPAPVQAPTATPVPAGGAAPSPATPAPQQAVKVLYLVGQVDGLDGSTTEEFIEDSERDAQALRQMGFDVALFEAGKQHWSDVLKQAPGAKVLVYRGHGIYRGDFHHPETVGGFNLAPGEFVAKEQIANDLRVMSPGWVAILPSSCYAAGQSGPEWNQDIGLEEAKRRVATYSEDFLAGGAACYFAGGAPQALLRNLLAGSTCGEAVEPRLRFSDLHFQHPSYPNAALWLGRWEVNYTDAFVGNPDAKLN